MRRLDDMLNLTGWTVQCGAKQTCGATYEVAKTQPLQRAPKSCSLCGARVTATPYYGGSR